MAFSSDEEHAVVSTSDESNPRMGSARRIAAAGSLIIGAVAVCLWFGRGEALGVHSFDVISDAKVIGAAPAPSTPVFKGTVATTPGKVAPASGNRCILCYQAGTTSATGCTLDNGKSWVICPKERPYLAEISKTCGAQASWCSQPPVQDCLDCGNGCKVKDQTLQCGPTTPVYVLSQATCASVCTANPILIAGPTVPLGPVAPVPGLPVIPPVPGQPVIPAVPTAGPTAGPTAPAVATTTPTTTKPSFCATITAGTCKLMSCSSSRGEVVCNKDYKCECKPGACVDNEGKCSKPGTPGTTIKIKK